MVSIMAANCFVQKCSCMFSERNTYDIASNLGLNGDLINMVNNSIYGKNFPVYNQV